MTEYLSKGIYTTSEAARLIGVDVRSVRRWAVGYSGPDRFHKPVIDADYKKLDHRHAVSFLDLVELLFVHGFRETGVSWHQIREAAEVAGELFQTDHPFAMRKWFADPAGVFVEMDRQTGESVFVELSGAGQVAMKHTLDRYLDQLEFDLDDLAKRWFPAGKEQPIVCDPRISFGTPVIKGTRLPTETVAAEYTGPDSTSEIAWAHDVDEWKVEAAVEFEERLRAA